MIAVDVTTGLYTFQALAPAIMRQFRFGEGCFINSSLMSSAAAYQGGKLMEWVFPTAAAGALHAGRQLQDKERLHHGVGDAPASLPPAVRADRPRRRRRRPRAAEPRGRIKNAPKIIKALKETMPSKTTEEWIAILQPKEVFCERVNNYTDYLEHPHVKESGAIDWIEQERRRPPAGRQHPRPAARVRTRAAAARPAYRRGRPRHSGRAGLQRRRDRGDLHPRRHRPAVGGRSGEGGGLKRRPRGVAQ